MLFELRGVFQNLLLGMRPIRHRLHRRLGRTGMNGDLVAAQARLDFYRAHIPIEGKKVLELGPGHTPEVLLLARRAGAARCSGLDVERLVEPKGVRERGVELDLYDGTAMPYASGTFDVVWSSDVLEHVHDPEGTLKECFRVLAPGGRLSAIIDLRDHYFLDVEEKWTHCLKYTDAFWRAISSNRSSFVNRLRSSKWRALLESTGFEIDVYEEEKSDVLRRLYERGQLRIHGPRLDVEDAATYRLQVFATKPAEFDRAAEHELETASR